MKLTFVSTYPPRRCGLATFTDDLRTALTTAQPSWGVMVAAIDRDAFQYGPEVIAVVPQDDAEDYRRAARTIAAGGSDLVVIQHEYGIFGGHEGSHVLELANELRLRGVPYVVTLHTVLAQPSRQQERTLAALCAGATRITVFTRDARNLVTETGIADPERLVVVPHGAPTTLNGPVSEHEIRPVVARALAAIDRKLVVTTFGLLGPGKGLENAIAAMPAVVEHHPDLRYAIAGATHPEVARHTGESYRIRLQALATDLDVARQIVFLDTFLSEPELGALLRRTDLFLTPYRSPDQACSGALTFALAAGCPVLSTAYRYAVEMLAPRDGSARGMVVPCDDTGALAEALVNLLGDPKLLGELRRAAVARAAQLRWPAVADRFAEVFADALTGPTTELASTSTPRHTRLCLDHLHRLTDEIGIVQFATGSTPDPDSGYCVDDVARLAIVAADIAVVGPSADPSSLGWIDTALRFLDAALAPAGMHNVLGRDGMWRDPPHVGDHVGRAVWGLGVVAGSPLDSDGRARRLLDRVLPLLARADSLRTVAYAALGLTRCGDRSPDQHEALIMSGAGLAAAALGQPDHTWFEPRLTYDSARLPHALLVAGQALNDVDMVSLALSALDWYLTQVGLLGPGPAILRRVGYGWRSMNADGPPVDEGDEQPLDAAAVVEALACAWQATHDHRYATLAQRALAWFHGANRAGVPVYDPLTGGCRDGLSAVGVSDNQGAESTLAYHQAVLTLVGAGLLAVCQPDGATPIDADRRERSHRPRWRRTPSGLRDEQPNGRRRKPARLP